MHDFLGDARRAIPDQGRATSGAVTTILFTDIVGHTEMMQRLGDTKGLDGLREHERITRETLKGQGGADGKVGKMTLACVFGVAAGLALDHYGICPMVKRIWTPSWALFSGGVAFGVLAILYAMIDLTGFVGWTYPLRVIGRLWAC